METLKKDYESLMSKLGNDFNLSSVLEFISFLRTDDVELYKKFLKDYKEVGYYDTRKLIDLYCESNRILLNDENANEVFKGLVNNVWNDNMSYHLTTSVSACNIYENGMDPSKKEAEVLEDIDSLASLLSDEGKKMFFPFALDDKTEYSFASIPKLSVNYGRKPEWFLNLTFYSNGNVNEIMKKIMPFLADESVVAQEKMFEVVDKYYNLYNNSSRTLVVIPGLNPFFSQTKLDEFNVNNVDDLEKTLNQFLSVRSGRINESTDKVVPSDELMFIDVKTRNIVNFENINKKI